MEAFREAKRDRAAADGEKETEEVSKKYKEIIAKLPQRNGWNVGDLQLYQYQGFWYYEQFLEGLLAAQDRFKPRPSDIILCSTPKSGTAWLKALMFAIVTRASSDFSNSPLLSKVPHECLPLMEIDLAYGLGDRDPNLPLLATHVPYSSLPTSVIDSGCKLVYIWRDPKDAFVSFYHFIGRIAKSMNNEALALQEAFQLYCEGVCYYGPYWDHVLSYWKASLENPGRILILKFEEMKEKTEFFVKKLAEFMGYPFSMEEEEKGMVETITKMCSFENLSNLDVNRNGKHRGGTSMEVSNNVFFRKGEVGDWRNCLTPDMASQIDSITKEKLGSAGLCLGI